MQVFACFVVIAALWKAGAYHNGPPSSTCLTLYPKHSSDIQTGTPPFELRLSATTYAPGQQITVEIIATSPNRTFKGFQVTARRVNNSTNPEELLGIFNTTDGDSKVITCLGQPQKMLGHATNATRAVVNATWTAPTQNAGDIVFHATVVENKTVIWYDITATLRTSNNNNIQPPVHTVPPVTTLPGLPDWDECGTSKGCFLYPGSSKTTCSGDDCVAALSYRSSGDLFTFELTAEGQDFYVAVGFSEDRSMGDDQVVICTALPGHQTVQMSYNPTTRKTTNKQYTIGLSNLSTKQQNGRVYCTFNSTAKLVSIKEDGSSRTFDLGKEKYYLFLAWGPLYRGTDVISKHTQTAISPDMMDLLTISGAVPMLTGTSALITSALCLAAWCLLKP
ncbi:putative ferric-chelate reductase 1 isoform X2 [Pomacea canaliculata]|uniref:putative ferric-chelate reductase 1 isoform X2 n=1 Tax=Pomacea canaliculata TaxID=400727 RepID=UPI000D72D0F9|nr:putative ferric-chelate reductase 1 isoform X2 [Pomacea canaliculata]